LGYPTVVSSSARGIAGPKGIPEPISKKLQAAFKKALEDAEHVEKMEKVGLAVKIMMGEEYGRYLLGLHDKDEAEGGVIPEERIERRQDQ
jgi:tripartite-type tricarboxylate transporter receptor subunit TctC